jgi:hypothetical protein
MLCFTFVGDTAFTIDLCEETIRYSAYREHGIHIGTTLLVTPNSPSDPFIYLLHRRYLNSIGLALAKSWDNDSSGFPYGYLFSHINSSRARYADGTVFVNPVPNANRELEARLLAPDTVDEIKIEDYLAVPDELCDEVPFTCLKIGPFPEKPMTYVLRVESHISGKSFTSLVQEDSSTATRIYSVYGPDYIIRHILAVDLPQARASSRPDTFKKHFAFFESVIPQKIILPSIYSIIAVDNPNCRPDRLRTRSLTDDIQCLTAQIDKAVYDHPIMKRILGCLHWFVCTNPTKSFFLQLEGPMALSEVPQRADR